MEIITAAAASAALLAGVLAAFNPCGFALLPAYITVIVTGSAAEGVTKRQALRRAISFGSAMTLGFVTIFIGFGALFAAANVGLQGDVLPYIAYVTLVLGVLLVILGIHMLRGGELNVPGLKIKGAAPTRAFGSQIIYGMAFALASMSCTIGVYIPIITSSLNASNPLAAALPSVVYAIGMGTSVLIVSMVAAVAGSAGMARFRRHTPTFMKAAGGLMVIVGLYVVVYGLADVLPQFGIRALDPVLLETAAVQGDVLRTIQGWGNPALVVLAVATAVLVSFLWWKTRPEPEVDGESNTESRNNNRSSAAIASSRAKDAASKETATRNKTATAKPSSRPAKRKNPAEKFK